MKYDLLKRIELQDDSIVLEDLLIVKVLGSGMFGHVFLVVHKEKRTLYALKCVPRIKIACYELH
jgi:serine/threonine protein kinase